MQELLQQSSNLQIAFKFKNYVLHYKDVAGCDAKCGILLWHAFHIRKQVPCAPAVVLMVELSNNKGRSVTNAGSTIATVVQAKENLPPFDTVWFEVYEDDLKQEKNAFRLRADAVDLVSFDTFVNGVTYSNQSWERYGMAALKELLKNVFGVTFDDAYMDNMLVGKSLTA